MHDYGFATRMNVQSSVDRLPEVIRGMVFFTLKRYGRALQEAAIA